MGWFWWFPLMEDKDEEGLGLTKGSAIFRKWFRVSK